MDSFSEDIAQWKSVVADAETELKQLEGQVTEASARKSGAGQLDDNRVRARRIAEWEDVKARQMVPPEQGKDYGNAVQSLSLPRFVRRRASSGPGSRGRRITAIRWVTGRRSST